MGRWRVEYGAGGFGGLARVRDGVSVRARVVCVGESFILWLLVCTCLFTVVDADGAVGTVEWAPGSNKNSPFHPAIVVSIVFCIICILLLLFLCRDQGKK